MKFLCVCTSLWAITLVPAQDPRVYQLTDPFDHSECPTWDTRTFNLYFVNIHAGEIWRYNYGTNSLDHITLDGEVAPVIPSEADPNLLIVGLDRSVVAVNFTTESPVNPRTLTTVSNQFPTSRFNDGKADILGRLWIGTMGYESPDGLTPNQGVFYQVTCENLESPTVEIAPVNISNGIAFNKANTILFYIDTPTGQVAQYDFDKQLGQISNRRVVFDVNDRQDVITGRPDGMTIDEDDNLWVALYGGGAIVKVDSSTGDLLQIIPIPADDVTSAMWGGPFLDILYVTTSRWTLTEEQREQQPAAGAVFAVYGLGTRGVPVFNVDLVQSLNDEECHAK